MIPQTIVSQTRLQLEAIAELYPSLQDCCNELLSCSESEMMQGFVQLVKALRSRGDLG